MEQLRFLHIPKTAGSTLNAILLRLYLGNKVFSLTHFEDPSKESFESKPSYFRENIKLFFGHAPLITGIEKADNFKTITLLREPISRVKSFCQHVAEGKSEYLLFDFPPETFDLDKFLDCGDSQLSNFQTKILLGNRSYATLENLSTTEAIEQALDNLFNKIAHFGIQEYFDESLIIFSNALGWGMPFYVSKNTKDIEKTLTFEERHIEKIKALNIIDLAVYSQAKLEFEKSLTNSSFDNTQLKRFRWINRVFHPIIKIEYKIIELIMRYGGWLFRTPIWKFFRQI